MRDILIFIGVFSLLPFCFWRPYFGLLIWSWLGYMNPHRLTWGFAFDFPFVQLAAICTLLGMLAMVLGRRRFSGFSPKREGYLLMALCVMFVITTVTAIHPDWAWPELEKIAKIVLMAGITVMLVDDRKKLRYLLFLIALSIGFYGVKGGVFALASGGTSRVYGPVGSFMEDNNAIALGLVMVLPIVYYLARSEANKWVRRALMATFGLSAIAVVFTYSRGGLLGLIVVSVMIAIRLSLGKRMAVFGLALLALPVVLQKVPEQLVDRAATIQNYEKDGSAQARFGAWRTAWGIAVDRPLVGGGFQIVNDRELGLKYNPEFGPGGSRAGETYYSGAHSIYFEVLGENGFVAFAIFVGLVLSTILSARRVSRIAAREERLQDFYCYGQMIQISLCAYAVSGAFQEFASFDLFYQLVAVTIVVRNLLDKELDQRRHGTSADDRTAEAAVQRARASS